MFAAEISVSASNGMVTAIGSGVRERVEPT
jgi:hypothetical protein